MQHASTHSRDNNRSIVARMQATKATTYSRLCDIREELETYISETNGNEFRAALEAADRAIRNLRKFF